MSRVLVTGGAGFIGSHVVDALVDREHDVVVLDLLHPLAHRDRPGYLNPAATYVWADLVDRAALDHALTGVDVVCHHASMVGLGRDLSDVEGYVRHNDLGTAALLLAMYERRFRGRLLLASSMVVYGEGRYRCRSNGDVRPLPRSKQDLRDGRFDPRCPQCLAPLTPLAVPEDSRLDPRNVYAATKVHQEHLCFAFGREAGVDVVALRYHNVYGPRMPRDTPYAGVASIFRAALEAGRRPRVFEDGRQLRDFVHVEDVARVNVLAVEAPPGTAGPFNVASGWPHTLGEMASALCQAFGAGVAPEVTGEFRLGDVRHVFASPERAARELGFTAETTFEDGIRRFARAPLREPAGRSPATSGA